MNYRLLVSVILFLCVFECVNAQSHERCGTHVRTITPAFQQMLLSPPNECNFILKARKTFQLTVHISRDSLQPPITTIEQINEAIAGLNEAFEPCEMVFEVCEENYLQDFHFYEWIQEEDEEYAFIYHLIPNTINIFLSSSVESTDEGPVGGYAYFPDGPEAMVIAVDNDGTVPIGTLVHEMGHFFGLLHTFEDEFGIENISQDNCDTSGDFLCDTEADPEGTVDDECVYTGPYDDGNSFYTPPVDNWMSYYGSCRCRFTIQQYNKMVENYLNSNRFNLW